MKPKPLIPKGLAAFSIRLQAAGAIYCIAFAPPLHLSPLQRNPATKKLRGAWGKVMAGFCRLVRPIGFEHQANEGNEGEDRIQRAVGCRNSRFGFV
jgi:hypothetical protein